MSKFKILFNGEYEDEVFDTEEEAEDHALYLCSCAREGAEILHTGAEAAQGFKQGKPHKKIRHWLCGASA